MQNKSYIKDIFVVGFAMFAIFFGAGNLIFPPYLGFQTANQWMLGFICFILTDVVLSIFAIMMLARTGRGVAGITDVIGKNLSKILMLANAICLGPLIAIPRTAATTHEFAVVPIFEGVSSWVTAFIFFAVCIACCIKQSKVVDIIGSVLSPAMLVALAVLIISGIVNPIGPISDVIRVDNVAREGIVAGYQTMDMLGGIVFSVAVMTSIVQKGYSSKEKQIKMIGFSGIVAGIGLFLVYGGLAYLGASVSSVYPEGLSQSQLLVQITRDILGQPGVILLGFIVAAACLTTSIGLLTSFSETIVEMTGGKIKYKTVLLATSAMSCVISNFGISTIISLAAPILEIIYPIFVVLVFMSLFSNKIKNNLVYKMAAGVALVISLMTLLENYTSLSFGIASWPLASYGFAWVLPAIAGAVVGLVVSKNKA